MKTTGRFFNPLVVSLAALISLRVPRAQAAPGVLDGTFGTGGKVIVDIGIENDHGRSVAVQSDGKIVVAGTARNGDQDFALVRYTASGGLDSSFGTGGKVTTDIGGGDDWGYSVAVQSDGKIVLAGTSGGNFALVRYTAAGGALDSSFGTGGKVTTGFGTGSDAGQSVAVQSDGKILVAGYSWNGSDRDFALVRFTASGTLDSSFGTGGRMTTDFGSGDDLGYSVAVQSDGKILVAGTSDGNFALVRHTASGALDSSFGTGGKVTADFISGTDGGHSVAVLSDGKILVAGYARGVNSPDFAVARYTASGNLDFSFGTSGKVTTGFGGGSDYGQSVAVQSDGKIVVGGYSWNGSNDDIALVRYTASGVLDNSFGAGGKVRTALGSSYDRAYSVAVQSDGTIVAAGIAFIGSSEDTALLRYTASGVLDNSFGAGGTVTTNIGRGSDSGRSVAVQSDGKIVVAGDSWNGSDPDIALVRYTSSGALDSSFGTGGVVTTTIDDGYDRAYSVAVQSDGKIVIAGYTQIDSRYYFALVRYTASGALDSSFGTGGKVTASPGTGDDHGQSVAVQNDGKIVVGGYADNSPFDRNEDFALVRFTASGTLDSSFGTGGRVVTPIGSYDDYGSSVAIQSDGKIVLAGTFWNGSSRDMALVRYTASGALDSSFGTGGKVTTAVGSYDDFGSSVAVHSDGKIVVAGSFWNGSEYEMALVRYTDGGALDSSFGTGGKVTTDIGSGGDSGSSVAVQSDGKIVLAGSSTDGGDSKFALVRYTASGALDGSFGTGGKVTTDIGSGGDYGSSVALQSDGRIVVAGGSNSDFAVVRYYSDSAGPGIALSGNGAGIANGDTIPGATDHTDFGSTAVAGGTVARTFTITNCGSDVLNLTGTAPNYVALAGSSAFTVITQPASGTVAGNGGTATFVITYNPGDAGMHIAIVSIDSDDSTRNPFTFAITGAGLTAQEFWRQQYFGTAGNTGNAADDLDFDGDGLVNLIEWACELNPTAGSTLPASLIRDGANLEFTYSRSVAAVNAGAVFNVEWSDTMQAATWNNEGVTSQVFSDNGTVQTVKATLPAGSGARRFVHLKLTAPP